MELVDDFPVGAVGGRGVTFAVDAVVEPRPDFFVALENEGLAESGLGFCMVALAVLAMEL